MELVFGHTPRYWYTDGMGIVWTDRRRCCNSYLGRYNLFWCFLRKIVKTLPWKLTLNIRRCIIFDDWLEFIFSRKNTYSTFIRMQKFESMKFHNFDYTIALKKVLCNLVKAFSFLWKSCSSFWKCNTEEIPDIVPYYSKPEHTIK